MEQDYISVQNSRFNVQETMDKIASGLAAKGVTIYSRINQQQEAARAGLRLRPLEFLLFGNPHAGGQVMAVNPVAALDLPLKIIVWENAKGSTLLAYNRTGFLESRYRLDAKSLAALDLTRFISELALE